MRFAGQNFIYGFLIVLVLAVFYLWVFKMRRLALEKFARKALLKELLSSVDLFRQRLKITLIILSVALIILALMRPQWGFKWQEIKRKGIDILIAVDTSRSMLAKDILPTRLERAKLAIRDFTKNLKGDRVGLIAFAGSAFLQCPLTVDYGGFLISLDALSADTIPKGGTSISSAIREAIKSYAGGHRPEGHGLASFGQSQKKYKVLIIITDGEDHEGDPLKAAEDAKNEGVTVFSIGLGTKEGDIIPLEGGYLKDREGNVVKSRLDEVMLQKIALATAGSYVRSTNTEFGLDLLYKEKLSKMEKRELESKMAKHYEERFQVPLALALVLLLAELFISERRK